VSRSNTYEPQTGQLANGAASLGAEEKWTLNCYLRECRDLVIEEIRRFIPNNAEAGRTLYELMLDYPLREAKGLRAALCIASCRAIGGTLESIIPTAAVLELYHNAFLIHDDIEDDSHLRRGRLALHQEYGVPIAINVGDAMLALSLYPLLDNIRVIGLGPSLLILDAVARMTRESVEGQALELDWIRERRWDLTDADYVRMVEKKTSWYTFVTPMAVGVIAGGATRKQLAEATDFAMALGVAFQIQDDILNLEGDEALYGKESWGDLWEGKRTLMLLHALRQASPADRDRAQQILAADRPPITSGRHSTEVEQLIATLVTQGDLSERGRLLLSELLGNSRPVKREEEIRWLRQLLERQGSMEYARSVAASWASQAASRLEPVLGWMPASQHRRMIEELVAYVHERLR
jgi:geranylgeranyl diphosphate synthase, type II